VLDHLLLHAGPAFWVDANGHATTTTLSQIAPSRRRLLDRIHVARGFTAYQHYGAVSDLPTAVNQSIQESTSDDSLRNRQPTENDDESPHPLAHRRAGRRHPVSGRRYPRGNTRGNASDPNARPVGDLRRRVRHPRASHPDQAQRLHSVGRDGSRPPPGVRANPNGAAGRRRRLRDALVYPVDDGAYYQTTFAYWRQLLAARAPRRSAWNRRRRRRRRRLRKASGRGVTADGETVAATADPLLDAWTATGTGGR